MTDDDFAPDRNPGAPVEPSRRLELLVDLVLEGLPPEDLAELEQLGGEAALGPALAAAAAGAELALGKGADEPLPVWLQSRVVADADVFFNRRGDESGWRKSGWRAPAAWLGWVAAAASLVFSFVVSRQASSIRATPSDPPLTERLANLPPLRFTAADHPLARGAEGELFWSGERQEGYMAIRGLAEVEPTRGVYQLWIFDETRDPRFPIDGAVFSIADASGTTIVPVHATVPVRRPTLFAITLEPAGGVVVSDRKRIMLTASVSR